MSPGSARIAFALGLLLWTTGVRAEGGYDLWLRYTQISNANLLARYRSVITGIQVVGDPGCVFETCSELRRGLRGLLGQDVPVVNDRLPAVVASAGGLFSAFGIAG